MKARTVFLSLEVLTDLPVTEIRKIIAVALLKDLEDASGVIVPVVQCQANAVTGKPKPKPRGK